MSPRLSGAAARAISEQIMQAADVSHTLQDFATFVKWNEHLYHEILAAHVRDSARRAAAPTPHPREGWFRSQIGFYDFYIIPLAERLDACGAFGPGGGHGFAARAVRNKERWLREGEECTRRIVAAAEGMTLRPPVPEAAAVVEEDGKEEGGSREESEVLSLSLAVDVEENADRMEAVNNTAEDGHLDKHRAEERSRSLDAVNEQNKKDISTFHCKEDSSPLAKENESHGTEEVNSGEEGDSGEEGEILSMSHTTIVVRNTRRAGVESDTIDDIKDILGKLSTDADENQDGEDISAALGDVDVGSSTKEKEAQRPSDARSNDLSPDDPSTDPSGAISLISDIFDITSADESLPVNGHCEGRHIPPGACSDDQSLDSNVHIASALHSFPDARSESPSIDSSHRSAVSFATSSSLWRSSLSSFAPFTQDLMAEAEVDSSVDAIVPRILVRQLLDTLRQHRAGRGEGREAGTGPQEEDLREAIQKYRTKGSIQRHRGALLFVDISGFTHLSQHYPIEDFKTFINRYFTKIIDLIVSHGGEVVKFAGDALYALWKTADDDKIEDCHGIGLDSVREESFRSRDTSLHSSRQESWKSRDGSLNFSRQESWTSCDGDISATDDNNTSGDRGDISNGHRHSGISVASGEGSTFTHSASMAKFFNDCHHNGVDSEDIDGTPTSDDQVSPAHADNIEKCTLCAIAISTTCNNFKVSKFYNTRHKSSAASSTDVEGRNQWVMRRRSSAISSAVIEGKNHAEVLYLMKDKNTEYEEKESVLNVYCGVSEGIMAGVDVVAGKRAEFFLVGRPLQGESRSST